MKLISLNTWGGRAGKKELLSFFEKNKDVDVFCLQEMWNAPYDNMEGHDAGGLAIKNDDIMTHGVQEVSHTLSKHRPYFAPPYLGNYGLLILVKREFEIVDTGEVFVYKHKGYEPTGDIGDHARNIQYITLKTDKGLVTFINFHGLWKKGVKKEDIPERIEQSQKIVEFLKTLTNPFVFAGDFNLLPESESIKIIENAGYKNLIKEYKIKSTRTSYYKHEEKHADYAFVSNSISVNDFKVLPDEVSDHSPLYLDFNY